MKPNKLQEEIFYVDYNLKLIKSTTYKEYLLEYGIDEDHPLCVISR